MRDAFGRWTSAAVGRRAFVAGLGAAGVSVGFLPLLRLLPPESAGALLLKRDGPRFLDPHQWDVVEAATARLIPGPQDDARETTPGAREAGAVVYVDLLLSAFDDDAPMIYGGGPFSGRNGGGDGEMAEPVPLRPWQEELWRARIAALQDAYRVGIAELDEAAGGDFVAADLARRDEILAADTPSRFRRVLFEHAIEAMYAVPEYGGNASRSGWESIGFAGDVAPRGWSAEQVSASDGRDRVPEGFEMPFPAQILDGAGSGGAEG